MHCTEVQPPVVAMPRKRPRQCGPPGPKIAIYCCSGWRRIPCLPDYPAGNRLPLSTTAAVRRTRRSVLPDAPTHSASPRPHPSRATFVNSFRRHYPSSRSRLVKEEARLIYSFTKFRNCVLSDYKYPYFFFVNEGNQFRCHNFLISKQFSSSLEICVFYQTRNAIKILIYQPSNYLFCGVQRGTGLILILSFFFCALNRFVKTTKFIWR